MFWAWASLLLRSGLILAAAEMLRRGSRKSSAAYRHRIVASGFALLLLWPALSAVLPQVSLPVWPHHPDSIVTVTQTMHFVSQRVLPMAHVNWPLSIWAFGAFLSLLPVLIGYFQVRRMVSAAVPVTEESWRHLLIEECSRLGLKKTPILVRNKRQVVPLAFGVRRPCILLPFDCTNWNPSRKRMVLLHELMHLRRRDLSWQMFANLTTALWWFQPLCWLNRRALRQESEEACDAWVLESGIRPSDYATQLLQIAQCFRPSHSGYPVATAMAQRGHLESRLYAILNPKARAGRNFPMFKILALAGLTLSASALAIFPNQNEFKGGHPMKRTLISGLLASAGLTAATISGSVFDPSGAAVSNAEALLYNPDTGVKQEAATSPDGKFAFQSLPAGSYILHIQKPGFASLYREFNVQTDSDVQRGLVLTNAATAAPASQEPTDAARIHVGGQLAEQNIIQKVQPVYPTAAKSARVQGTVELEVAISKEGVPEDIRVIASPSDDLTQSALEAVRQWRYRPTLLNGQPVAIVTDVIVNYTLSK
jgi:TonB family protein